VTVAHSAQSATSAAQRVLIAFVLPCMSILTGKDYYKILGVSRNFTESELSKVRQLHPTTTVCTSRLCPGIFSSILDRCVCARASHSTLMQAKRKKALMWHPDRWASKGKAEQEKATAMMKDVNEAFSVLSDPKKRRRYDNGEDDLDGPDYGTWHCQRMWRLLMH